MHRVCAHVFGSYMRLPFRESVVHLSRRSALHVGISCTAPITICTFHLAHISVSEPEVGGVGGSGSSTATGGFQYGALFTEDFVFIRTCGYPKSQDFGGLGAWSNESLIARSKVGLDDALTAVKVVLTSIPSFRHPDCFKLLLPSIRPPSRAFTATKV